MGTVVFDNLTATDPDSNVNGQVEFRIVGSDPTPPPGVFGLFFSLLGQGALISGYHLSPFFIFKLDFSPSEFSASLDEL